jgi:hypothetical protein
MMKVGLGSAWTDTAANVSRWPWWRQPLVRACLIRLFMDPPASLRMLVPIVPRQHGR